MVDDTGDFSYNKSAREASGMEHDIGSKIKAARLEKKLTQEQVAELLGVSRQTISNWENEKSLSSLNISFKLSRFNSEALNITIGNSLECLW